MEYVVRGREPQRVFNIFEDICAIPHGSGNESGVARYICEYARNRGLDAETDGAGNVLVKKPAKCGYEMLSPILLQGHMDMVCEKNEGVEHDFSRDGLKLYIEDGYLTADGTTLGADNGIAVAMMLALLDEETLPPIELLFTVEEETGLFGAGYFDCSRLSAKQMINLDSEEENTVTAGCAGGVRTDISLSLEKEENSFGCLDIKVSGLAGGHSGADIDTGRSSAVNLMTRLLMSVHGIGETYLVSLSCDGKDNAIARECRATVACKDPERVSEILVREAREIKKELCANDGGFCLSVEPSASLERMTEDFTRKVLTLLCSVRTGVIKKSNNIAGLVEYSRNLGVIGEEGGMLVLTYSTRSSIEAQLDASCRELDLIGACGVVKHHSRYPGWEYAPISPLRDRYLDSYERLFGSRPCVTVIHAGLECGIISSKTSGMDIISIGPDMKDIHSPDEKLSLDSCCRIWKVLLETLNCGA